MSFLILLPSLVSSLALAADAPLNWIKPVDPNLNPSQATVFVMISRTQVNESTLGNINNWQPDGFLLIDGEQATRSNILIGLNQVRQYGHIILDVDLLGNGGDFGDPNVLPYGADPDNVEAGLRPSEIMKALQGNQTWVAVISNTMNDDVTSGSKQALIGPDASQWIESAVAGSNVFVLTASNMQNLPSATCQENFGNVLFGHLAENHATGKDLSFYDLYEAARAMATVTILTPFGTASCDIAPVAKYSGSVTPKTVMLQGSGVLPEPVVTVPPKFVPTIDPVIPLTSVPMVVGLNEQPKPKKHVDSVIMYGVGGACAVGGVVTGVIFANQKKATDEQFSDANVEENFASKDEAQKAADQASLELTLGRNTTIGLAGCAGLAIAGGTVTWLLSSNGVGVTVPF